MRNTLTTLMLLSLLALGACGFANNMTGQIIRGAPQVVLNGVH